jgi:UDP-N-acetylmuramoyl-L-alanyl-D-glutamate--2,6-diaminopimelate ligase
VIAIIDFAHTPNGIKAILSDVKKRFKTDKNRIIHVFGSAAKRDESKRPIMGEESGSYADTVILTEEDYRDENPEKIAGEIAGGLLKKGFKESDLTNKTDKSFCILTNRKEAIEKALEIANPGDIIVLTGKGHEKSICRGKVEYPWDERKTVLEALRVYKAKSP